MTIYCPECKSPVTMDDDRCPWCGFDPFFDPLLELKLDEDEEYEDDEC